MHEEPAGEIERFLVSLAEITGQEYPLLRDCVSCHRTKTLSCFEVVNDVRDDFCRLCRNRDGRRVDPNGVLTREQISNLNYKQNTRAENRRIIFEIKKGPCAECGERFHPVCMDFDHIRGKKFKNISQMIHQLSTEALIQELKKCALVCAVCHRLRTRSRQTGLSVAELRKVNSSSSEPTFLTLPEGSRRLRGTVLKSDANDSHGEK